jgi:alpha-beta hydrolase superfamily lysophospholipase
MLQLFVAQNICWPLQKCSPIVTLQLWYSPFLKFYLKILNKRRSNRGKWNANRRRLKDQMATREGGSEYEPVKILLKEPGLYPSQIPVTHKRWIESHTNRQDNEVMDQPLVLGTIP